MQILQLKSGISKQDSVYRHCKVSLALRQPCSVEVSLLSKREPVWNRDLTLYRTPAPDEFLNVWLSKVGHLEKCLSIVSLLWKLFFLGGEPDTKSIHPTKVWESPGVRWIGLRELKRPRRDMKKVAPSNTHRTNTMPTHTVLSFSKTGAHLILKSHPDEV